MKVYTLERANLQISKEVDLTKGAVAKTVQRWKPRLGRPRKIDHRLSRLIKRTVDQEPTLTARPYNHLYFVGRPKPSGLFSMGAIGVGTLQIIDGTMNKHSFIY